MSRIATVGRDIGSPVTTADLRALCRERGLEVIEDWPLTRPLVAAYTSRALYLSSDLAPEWAAIFDACQSHTTSHRRMLRLLLGCAVAAREQAWPCYAFRLPIPQFGTIPPRAALLLLRAGLLTFGLRYPNTARELAEWGDWPRWACRLWLGLMAEQSARSEALEWRPRVANG